MEPILTQWPEIEDPTERIPNLWLEEGLAECDLSDETWSFATIRTDAPAN